MRLLGAFAGCGGTTTRAAQAAVAASNGRTYAARAKVAEELRQAMDSRAAIIQAIGILMGRHG